MVSSDHWHFQAGDLYHLTLRPCLLELYSINGGKYVYATWCDTNLEYGPGGLKVSRLDLM
jgi:hypothetical protein